MSKLEGHRFRSIRLYTDGYVLGDCALLFSVESVPRYRLFFHQSLTAHAFLMMFAHAIRAELASWKTIARSPMYPSMILSRAE